MWLCINMQEIRLFISPICSEDKVDYKILQSDWLRIFFPLFQEETFSQIWGLERSIRSTKIGTQQKYVIFLYITNSVKINEKIFQIIQKRCFWSFSQFWVQNFLYQRLWLSCTNSCRFLASCQNLERSNDTIPTPGQMERWLDEWIDLIL